jgi:hypothetical protein
MATFMAGSWILASATMVRSPEIALCFLPFALVAAAAVGGSAFLGLRDSEDSEERGVPALYQSMATLGVTSCLAVFSLVALDWAMQTLPILAALRDSLQAWLPGVRGIALRNTTQLLMLLPATFLAARWARRYLPKVPGWIQGLGLTAPGIFSLTILLSQYLRYPGLPPSYLLLGISVFMGTLPHLGALALGRRLEERRLLAGAQGLPASSSLRTIKTISRDRGEGNL